MIKALLLIFEPIAAWERILRARRSFAFILWTHLMPLLVVAALVEGYRLSHHERPGEVKMLQRYTMPEAVIYEIGQLVLLLGVILIGSHLVKSIGETFHGRHSYTQAFTTVAYGLSPWFLVRLLDGLKDMSPWASWGIGIALSVAVLYQGVPRIMEPDPTHAFGLYLMSALLLVLMTGLARFFTAWYLEGQFTALESVVSSLAAKLHS